MKQLAFALGFVVAACNTTSHKSNVANNDVNPALVCHQEKATGYNISVLRQGDKVQVNQSSFTALYAGITYTVKDSENNDPHGEPTLKCDQDLGQFRSVHVRVYETGETTGTIVIQETAPTALISPIVLDITNIEIN
ncbi:MAG: hypothetical protein AB7T49_11105 [Oligoflexales bacterium]